MLDFAGPFEVFSTAERASEVPIELNTFLVGETGAPVAARNKFMVTPHYNFSNHPDIDILIVPGGIHTNEMENVRVLEWLKKVSYKTKISASVCTGSFIYAAAKIFVNQQVTTHWDDIDDLRKQFPDLKVKENVRWIEDGKYISSAGISAGIDMSLHLTGKLFNGALAEKTAHLMDYEWNKKLL